MFDIVTREVRKAETTTITASSNGDHNARICGIQHFWICQIDICGKGSKEKKV